MIIKNFALRLTARTPVSQKCDMNIESLHVTNEFREISVRWLVGIFAFYEQSVCLVFIFYFRPRKIIADDIEDDFEFLIAIRRHNLLFCIQ